MKAISFLVILVNYSILKCISALDDIVGVLDNTYMKVVEKFTNSDWREIFVSKYANKRREWLIDLCSAMYGSLLFETMICV